MRQLAEQPPLNKRITNKVGLVVDAGIDKQDYKLFQQYLEDTCGIVLGDNKQYLVSSRLSKLMREQGVTGLGDLLKRLKTSTPGLRERIIEAMTTNETSWFRDNYPFDMLKETILPELGKGRGAQPVKIWSAACSSGQEPYSISMTVQEFLNSRPGALPRDVVITATDISPAILQEAKEGVYDSLAMIRGLSEERKKRFFTQKGDRWEIRPEIKARVMFRELNLMQSYALLGRFDIIFCRNVLIYFSTESKKDILSRMARALNPGGYLFLGGSESLASYSDDFETVRMPRGVVYRLKS